MMMGDLDPRERVSELRREAVDLLRSFRHGFENYKANRTLGPMIAGEFASKVLDLPKTKVERAVWAFQKDWETTPEYAQLESSLGDLRRRTTEFLRSVVEKTPRGYRRDLTGKLRPLSQVVRLETKISKLVGVLEALEGSELLYPDQIPKPRHRATPSRVTRARERELIAIYLALAGIVVGVAVPLSLILISVLGFVAFLAGPALALFIAAVVMKTRGFWIQRLRDALDRR